MIFGQPFGFSSFANSVALTQTLPIPWEEICAPSVNIVTEIVAGSSSFNQVADQLWVEQAVSTTGTSIKRC